MIGTFCVIIFFIAYLPYTECQRYHEFGMIESCSGSAGANEVLYIYENELAGYMDIEEAKLVVTVPDIMYSIFDFDKFKFDKFFDIDPAHTGSTSLCKETYFRILSLNISEPLEPPWTSIYPRNDVKLHVNNTLICLVSGFYPPPVRVSWTKNNVDVTDRSTVSRYYPNNDMTLNVFSRLSFIPEEGDIYSCSVEHKALQQPQTRTWDVEIKELSIGPSVFCGVGLTLGLLGLATGVFFIAKEKKWI